MRRVVITGIGVISPIGIGSKSFWDNLLAGQVGVRRIRSFDPSCVKANGVVPGALTSPRPPVWSHPNSIPAVGVPM